MNNFTKYLSFGVDFLFLRHPVRTSLGFIFGVVTSGVSHLNLRIEVFEFCTSIGCLELP